MSKFLDVREMVKDVQDLHLEERANILIVTKWNWDFKDCESFQQKCQLFIQKNRNLKIYIFTNHPHCYTLGRGNERGEDSLIDFDPELESSMEFPLYKIHRGGGVTFHYPGQWIFYPIVALKESLSLDDISCWLLKSVKTVLTEDFFISDVITAKKLMGVWRKKQKLASIGIGVSRFVTIHGIALNLVYDDKMFNELQKVSPCGMAPQTYTCANIVISQGETNQNLGPVELFNEKFISRLEP
jgi:lipoyl(octanoyl) transferase